MVGEIYLWQSGTEHRQHPKIDDYIRKYNLSGDIIKCPFSFSVEPIIAFSKEVAKDPKVLSQLNMHRTIASYKLKYEVAELFCDKLIQNLRGAPFSLNLDKATLSNQLHVVTVLASYYKKEQKSIAAEHLASVDVSLVNAASLFKEMKAIFARHDLPWENHLAMFMIKARPIHIDKSGLEVQIRESAPYLLNIDDHSYHHIHNIVKSFTSYFGSFLRRLFCDLYTDF